MHIKLERGISLRMIESARTRFRRRTKQDKLLLLLLLLLLPLSMTLNIICYESECTLLILWLNAYKKFDSALRKADTVDACKQGISTYLKFQKYHTKYAIPS